MRLHSSVAQATFCLALAIPPLATQPLPEDFQQVAATAQSWVGLGIIDIAPDKAQELGLDAAYGVEVAQVATNGPGQQAGIEPGDIITRFRDEQVQGAEHLARLVRETPAQRTVELEVWRNGEQQKIDVIIQERGAVALADRFKQSKTQPLGFGFDISRPVAVVHNRSLGVELETLKGQFAKFFGTDTGVLVRSVDPDSVAAEAGILVGDVIIAIGAGPIRYAKDIRREMQGASSPIKIGIVRNQRKTTVTLPDSEPSDDPWPFSSHPE